MPSPGQTSHQRGYGYIHQVKRKNALRALNEGDPCPFCGLGMFKSQKLDYDHETPLHDGGSPNGPGRLAHATCNRRAGGHVRWGTRPRRRPIIPPVITSREW